MCIKGNRENKSNATEYYNNSFRAAIKLQKEMSSAFEKNKWLLDLLIADSQSYIGSINTSTRQFEAGVNDFNNSLKRIDMIKQEHAVNPTDRSVEIAGFSLANDLRDRKSIESFLQNNSIHEYDKKFTELVKSENSDYERFTYAMSSSGQLIKYLDENHRPSKKDEENYDLLSRNIFNIMYNKHVEKMNRSFGKYLMIRGCFDFILARFNIGNLEQNINETEDKIINGLERIVKSYFIDANITMEDYLNDKQYYTANMQKDLGRNFTILYGLGVLFENDEVIKKYFTYLVRSYRKEMESEASDNGIIFEASINTTLEEVLAPFDLKLDSNVLINAIKDEVQETGL